MKGTIARLALVAAAAAALATPAGASSSEPATNEAASTPILELGAAEALDGSALIQVQYVNGRRYYPRRYGPRYRYRHGAYRYYYNGWWYARRWWRAAPPPPPPAVRANRCEYWASQCVQNWGFDNPDYYGCLRYYGC